VSARGGFHALGLRAKIGGALRPRARFQGLLGLLDARQALLARDPARFRADLETAQAWIRRYYDTRAKATAAAQASLKQLAASSINVELPSMDDSLAAVRKYKASHEKAAR
jgi:uncharacterized protein HemX